MKMPRYAMTLEDARRANVVQASRDFAAALKATEEREHRAAYRAELRARQAARKAARAC